MRSSTEEMARAAVTAPSNWVQRRAPLLLGAVVVFGLGLRVIALGYKSFWLDEIASLAICLRPGALFWEWVWHHEGNMALYYVLLKPWLHFGLNEGTVRLLSVIPGLLTIPAMYLLARRLFSLQTALLAALLVALSPCDVVYSQEARGYSLLVLAVTLATYLFVRLVEEPGWGASLAYGVAAAMMLYSHYFGLLAVAAQFASLVVLPRSRVPWRQLAIALVVLGILGTPVLWMIHIQDSAHLEWVQKPSLLELYHVGLFLAGEGGKAVGIALLIVELPLLAVFAGALFSAVRNRSASMWHYSVVASGLVTPIVISWLASYWKPVFFHRFLIICLPAWLLIVALGIEHIAQMRLRRTAFIVVCALSLVCVALSYRRVREDWRGATTFLIEHTHSSDRVLYYRPVAFFAAESYRDWLPDGDKDRPKGVQVTGDTEAVRKDIGNAQRMWLVQYQDQQDATLRTLQGDLLEAYRPVGTQAFRAITITEYDRK